MPTDYVVGHANEPGKGSARDRVHQTFAQWKRHKVPDQTALYHTLLDIRYRRGGFMERLALVQLRWSLRLRG